MISVSIIEKINQISSIYDKFILNRINEEKLPILKNHAPLFKILSKNGEYLLFNQIADIWKISKSSLSDIINKYEKQGLIKKCICSKDKRRIYISLTPEAIHIKDKLNEMEDEFLNSLLDDDFNKEQGNIFEHNIDRVLDNVKKIL